MNRNGVQPKQLPRLVSHCQRHNLRLEVRHAAQSLCHTHPAPTIQGLFTHFASSWDDPAFTAAQAETFLEAATRLDGKFLLHAANSGGLLRQFAASFDIARTGLPTADAMNQHTITHIHTHVAWFRN